MKRIRKSIAVTGLPFAGSLILGVVLLLLATGPAGAVSADEDKLFTSASDDRWHDDVRALLAKGASPNVLIGLFDRDQRAAMHAAAEGGAVKNLAAMLRAGGNPNLLDGEGNTPLHWASADRSTGGLTADYPAAIRLLVQHGADLHRPNRNGATPLHVAVYTGIGSAGVNIVRALLDAGAKPETVDGAGMTALQRFARSGSDRRDIVTLLLKAGANPDRLTPGGAAPLHLAIKHGGSYGKANVVEALLDGGAEPCVQDAEGYTPYHMSYEMTRIHQALERAEGHDLACDKKKQAEDTQQAEGGTGESRAGRAGKLKPGSVFRDCEQCPEMVVVPPGSFQIGALSDKSLQDSISLCLFYPHSHPDWLFPMGDVFGERDSDERPVHRVAIAYPFAVGKYKVTRFDCITHERPVHRVTIAYPFAVGKYEVTFAEWDACVAAGGCSYRPDDEGWGRGTRPVIKISWEDAQKYVQWLSRETGWSYRLLSEAEWEYVARAGTTTIYWWGNEVGTNNANCDGCGSQWDDKSTAPVGSFEANGFGVFDTAGNVSEWVEDCEHDNYQGAPTDGRAWTSGKCTMRVLRGGSWNLNPVIVRPTFRYWYFPGLRNNLNGFRLARTLTP